MTRKVKIRRNDAITLVDQVRRLSKDGHSTMTDEAIAELLNSQEKLTVKISGDHVSSFRRTLGIKPLRKAQKPRENFYSTLDAVVQDLKRRVENLENKMKGERQWV